MHSQNQYEIERENLINQGYIQVGRSFYKPELDMSIHGGVSQIIPIKNKVRVVESSNGIIILELPPKHPKAFKFTRINPNTLDALRKVRQVRQGILEGILARDGMSPKKKSHVRYPISTGQGIGVVVPFYPGRVLSELFINGLLHPRKTQPTEIIPDPNLGYQVNPTTIYNFKLDTQETQPVVTSIDKKMSINIIYSLIQKVKKLHSVGFIHCDLKLNNVIAIMDENTKKITGEVKLIDLESSVKIENALKGICPSGVTPSYCAPELLMEINYKTKKPYSVSVDIYSLGIMIAEIFNSKLFCDALQAKEVNSNKMDHQQYQLQKNNILQEFIFKITEPQDIKNLLLGMTKVNPAERPQIDVISDIFKRNYSSILF